MSFLNVCCSLPFKPRVGSTHGLCRRCMALSVHTTVLLYLNSSRIRCLQHQKDGHGIRTYLRLLSAKFGAFSDRELPFELSLQKMPVNVRYSDTAVFPIVPERLPRKKKPRSTNQPHDIRLKERLDPPYEHDRTSDK